jgi:hypothetical protein
MVSVKDFNLSMVFFSDLISKFSLKIKYYDLEDIEINFVTIYEKKQGGEIKLYFLS